jgi:hypothetical protein
MAAEEDRSTSSNGLVETGAGSWIFEAVKAFSVELGKPRQQRHKQRQRKLHHPPYLVNGYKSSCFNLVSFSSTEVTFYISLKRRTQILLVDPSWKGRSIFSNIIFREKSNSAEFSCTTRHENPRTLIFRGYEVTNNSVPLECLTPSPT